MDELKAAKNKTGEDKAATTVYESEFEKDAALDTSNVKSASESGFDEETLLLSNALIFFFGGFDTTSLGLSMITNKLALHPDLQEKVFAELEEVLGDSDDDV